MDSHYSCVTRAYKKKELYDLNDLIILSAIKKILYYVSLFVFYNSLLYILNIYDTMCDIKKSI